MLRAQFQQRVAQFSASGKAPPRPPPRPPPRRGREGAGRAPPGQTRGSNEGPTNRPPRSRKRTPFKKKNEVSWLGVGTVAVVGSLGASAMYYTQQDAPPLPKFVEEYVDAGNKQLRSIMGDDKDEEPVRDKLLPDFPKHLVQKDGTTPPTLVMCLDDLLIHVDWDRKHGYRVAMRPGVKKFLDEVSMYYETVIFTAIGYTAAEDILYNLDPHQYVQHRLFPDSMRKIKGKPVKDLSYLNRPLEHVVVLEVKEDMLPFHKENAIFVKPFNPKDPMPDNELKMLLPFLKALRAQNVKDYRQVLEAYGNRDVGRQYAEKLEEHRLRQQSKRQSSFFRRTKKAAPSGPETAKPAQQQQAPPATANQPPTPPASPPQQSVAAFASGSSSSSSWWSWLGYGNAESNE